MKNPSPSRLAAWAGQRIPLVMALGGAVMSGLVGYSLGSMSPETSSTPRLRADDLVRRRAPRRHNHDRDRPLRRATSDEAPYPDTLSETRAPSLEAQNKPLDLAPAFKAARKAEDDPDDEAAIEFAQAQADQVLQRLLRDPRALASALESLRGLQDRAELSMMAAVLGQIRDPEVEQAALTLARDGASEEQRVAAFDILDAIDAPSARPLALEALSRESDRGIREAALRAIGEPNGATVAEAGAVVEATYRLMSTERDSEIRRRAIVTLGRWHRSPDDLGLVAQSLTKDPDPQVRAGAAYAFELAGRRDPAIIQNLQAALDRQSEDPLVRENAWYALGALSPLPADAKLAYDRYAASRP